MYIQQDAWAIPGLLIVPPLNTQYSDIYLMDTNTARPGRPILRTMTVD